MDSIHCPFLKLPVELVENVATEIDKKDLLTLRLTCQDLCMKTHDVFARTFFHTIEATLSPTSMQRLQHISQHKYLKNHARALHLFGNGKTGGGGDRSETIFLDVCPRSWSKRRTLNWNSSMTKDLCTLLVTGFTRCRSFRIASSQPDMEMRDPGVWDTTTSRDILAVFLRVIALTGISVESLEINSDMTINPGDHCIPEFWDFGLFKQGWDSLLNLDLVFMNYQFELLEPHYLDRITDNTVAILSAASSLKRLKVDFFDPGGQSLLLREIYECNPAYSLEMLILKASRVSLDALLKFLSTTFHSLRTLELHAIMLKGDWHHILSALQHHCPSLENLTIVQLSYLNPEYGRVSFCWFRDRHLPVPFEHEFFEPLKAEGQTEDVGALQGISYKGKNMNVALHLLRTHVILAPR